MKDSFVNITQPENHYGFELRVGFEGCEVVKKITRFEVEKLLAQIEGLLGITEAKEAGNDSGTLKDMFSVVSEMGDRDVQLLLREVQADDLIRVCKVFGRESEMTKKILSNMSRRAAEMLYDDIGESSPTNMSDVVKSFERILESLFRLADEGQVFVPRKGVEYIR